MASHQSYARVRRRHMRVTDYHVFARGCTGKAGTAAPHAKCTQVQQTNQSPGKKMTMAGRQIRMLLSFFVAHIMHEGHADIEGPGKHHPELPMNLQDIHELVLAVKHYMQNMLDVLRVDY